MSSNLEKIDKLKGIIDSANNKVKISNLIIESLDSSCPMLKIYVGNTEIKLVDEQSLIIDVCKYISQYLLRDAEFIMEKLKKEL